jgi:hypothetical protein
MFHVVLRIELILQDHQIHDVEALYPPYNRQRDFRSADLRFGFSCHIMATNRPLRRMSRFKIEPALIPGHNFVEIVLWQKLTTCYEPYRVQLARQLMCDPSNVKVFHPQRVVQAVQHCCWQNPEELIK